MSKGGIPVQPYFVLGGFPGKEYREAQAAVMSILVDNFDHKSQNEDIKASLAKALEWEKSFVEFMHDYPKKNNVSHLFDLAFNSERSIEDELERETSGDIPTIGVSYALMVLYIVLALGRISSWKKFFIEGKLSLSLTGVILVLVSVGASIGMFGFFQVPATLIIFEILPFLVLAVGVDNIFIMVDAHQKTPKLENEEDISHIGRVIGDVAPSMFVSTAAQVSSYLLT